MSEKSISGINSFPNWVPQRVHEPYSHVRFFMESANHLSADGELATQSWLSHGQGKFLDDDLKQTHEAGKKITLCLQGNFPWQSEDGETNKKAWPVDWDATEDDKLDPDSYVYSKALAAQLAVVYSDDCTEEAAREILEPYKFPDKPDNFYANNQFRYALGYVDALEGPGNEYDFDWNGIEPQTPEVAGTGAFAWYRGVRSASQTMKVILPSNVGMESEGGGYGTASLRRMAGRFYELTGGNHTGVYLNAHLYPREGEWGPALNPEEFAFDFFNELTDICQVFGFDGFYVTEIGVATKDTSSDPNETKQRVKDMDGLNLEQAQAAWWRRLLLIGQTYPLLKAVHFWMCRDNYDTGQHRYSGRYSGQKADWSDAVEKDGGDIIRAMSEELYQFLHLEPITEVYAVSDDFSESFSEGIVWATNEQTHDRYGEIGPAPKFWKEGDTEVPEPGEDEVLKHLTLASDLMDKEGGTTYFALMCENAIYVARINRMEQLEQGNDEA